jgi:signal transduction histidine kinase
MTEPNDSSFQKDMSINPAENITRMNRKSILEERIKLAIEATGIGTWDYDLIQNTARYDAQCKKLFGFPPDAEFTYKDFIECIDAGDRIRRDEVLASTLAGEHSGRYETQYRIKTKDEGILRWISSKGKIFFNADGKPFRLIGAMLDITKEKLQEQQLEQLVRDRTASLIDANNQLAESNQNLSEFAYVASHDLQEPLRKINTFSQQLKEKTYGDQTDEVNAFLNKITDASKRMSRLIEDLLSYARLQNPEEAEQPTNLGEIVETVVRDFDLEISQTNAIVEVGNLPVVQAIPMRMNQLFQNLFSNSLKFIPAGEQPYIRIHSTLLDNTEKNKLDSLDQRRDYNEIIFSDNGIGFDPEYSEKIFTIFQRLNARSQYEGTGIGLAICRKIVMNHHGLITAHSREHGGSEFRIILPVAG